MNPTKANQKTKWSKKKKSQADDVNVIKKGRKKKKKKQNKKTYNHSCLQWQVEDFSVEQKNKNKIK